MSIDAPWDDELRHVLNHLHDPDCLRCSPLVRCLGVESGDDPAAALRTILEEAISAFRPAAPSTVDSKSWRHYQILYGCYVERATQQVVADRLGITPRHLRREQREALEALGGYLKLRYDLASDQQESRAISPDVRRGEVELNREMHWLADSLHDRSSAVGPMLRQAMDLAAGLARQRSVSLSLSGHESLPPVAIPSTVLQQATLNLITAAIRNLPPGGRLRLFVQAEGDRVAILVTSTDSADHAWSHLEALDTAVAMSSRLLELFDGELELARVDDILVAKVLVPAVDQRVTVLAVEDNLDTLDLWRRYVQGTSFSLVAETNPERAIDRAVALRPALIVLDVMMPGIDGWELLRAMRKHPALAKTPILVCTVLPQRELAMSLGASDFVQKPTTGRAFRAALERQNVAAARPR